MENLRDKSRVERRIIEMLAELTGRPAFEFESWRPSDWFEFIRRKAYEYHHAQLCLMLVGGLLKTRFGITINTILKLRRELYWLQAAWAVGALRPLFSGYHYVPWLVDNDAFNYSLSPSPAARIYFLFNRKETKDVARFVTPQQVANMLTRHAYSPKAFVRFLGTFINMLRQLKPWPGYAKLVTELMSVASGDLEAAERLQQKLVEAAGAESGQDAFSEGQVGQDSGETQHPDGN